MKFRIMQGRVLKCLTIFIFLFLLGCEKDFSGKGEEINELDVVPVLRYDMKQFANLFDQEKYYRDQLTWSNGFNKLEFGLSNSISLQSILILSSQKISKAELEQKFDSIGRYLNRARRDFLFNNVPIEEPIIELARDLLSGKIKIDRVKSYHTYSQISTISELLRIISIVSPEKVVPISILKSYPNLAPDKVLAIIVKGLYEQVKTTYNFLYAEKVEDMYLPMQCAGYQIVAPILKLDPQWSSSVEHLKSILPRLHEYLDQSDQIYGSLSMHLSCIEVMEEVLGKSPDPKTGEGLTERYIKFIAKYLWDYPFYARVCAPFGGVMSFIPVNKSSPDEFCRSNSKRVYDNLLLLYIIDTYLPSAVIYNSDYAPKSVDVNLANLKGEEMLKELTAMKEVKPSPAISPATSPSLKASPVGKKTIGKKKGEN